jgi:3-hydroxyisobutyrate dehydrogenase-like beta-hydroxyacid dehydrogenase
MNTTTTYPPVTVVGLGPMGQAMVRTLLAAGHPVTVWNRTPSRADTLVAEGATLAPSPADAIAAADLVILSLTDYGAMYEIFGPMVDAGGDDAFAGKVIVNLSSDTPETTRKASEWASASGARFVAGGIMVPAPMVSTEAAYVYYSGHRDAFDAHEPTLRKIGAPKYLGEDPRLAQLFYQAQLTVFLTALSGLLQGAALVEAAGVPVAKFLPEAIGTLAGIPAMLEGGRATADALASGVHPGDLSTVLMMGATADHIVGASDAAGIDLALPLAVKSQYDRAITAGYGRDNWTSLFEIIKRRPT